MIGVMAIMRPILIAVVVTPAMTRMGNYHQLKTNGITIEEVQALQNQTVCLVLRVS